MVLLHVEEILRSLELEPAEAARRIDGKVRVLNETLQSQMLSTSEFLAPFTRVLHVLFGFQTHACWMQTVQCDMLRDLIDPARGSLFQLFVTGVKRDTSALLPLDVRVFPVCARAVPPHLCSPPFKSEFETETFLKNAVAIVTCYSIPKSTTSPCSCTICCARNTPTDQATTSALQSFT